MRTTARICAVAFSLSLGTPSFAGDEGGCHFHGNTPATEKIVVACADKRKETLVKSGKIGKSWQNAKVDKAELVDGKKGKEWRVRYKDATALEKSKETLYILFTATGNFIAANYTGD